MKVSFSREADEDLADIRAYISLDSPRRAASFTRELVHACLAIGEAPRAWPVVVGYERSGFRRKAYRQYLIFYRVQVDCVQIIRVVHGRRDVERLLASDDP